MEKEQDNIINCYYKDKDNNIIFCKITYRNGIYFALEIPKKAEINMENDYFTCYDSESKVYILQNLLHKEETRHFTKNYYFQSLIAIPSNNYNGEEIKLTAINFTFPYINKFFYIVDSVDASSENDENALVYKKRMTFKKFEINKNFTIDLNVGYSYGGGNIGGKGGHFDLIKSVKISSGRERPLNEFIEIIMTLIDFFSICFRKKLLITAIWSNGKENTIAEKLEIKTFQFKILNKNYEDENDRNPFKSLATYALLNGNFDKIIKRFFKSKNGNYESFPVFCDLYMRNHDSPNEIYPQIKFLSFMQGIEAYISKLPCNKDFKLDVSWKRAIKEFKKQHPELPNVKKLKYSNQLAFQDKINNVINANKIENIIKFKMTTSGSYKLINQMVKFRNYYTHYGDGKNLKDLDFYDVIEYTKIFCEILIMKELGFKSNQIKISLNNNYYYLSEWNNEYCLLDLAVMPKGYSKKYYLGDIEDFSTQNYIKYALFYKPKENGKLQLIFKSRMAKGKTRAESITVNEQLTPYEYNLLKPIYQTCYDRYLEKQKQSNYRYNTSSL